MKFFVPVLFLVSVLLCWSGAMASDCGPKRVAFSFDDAPRPDTAVLSGPERTARLIAALGKAGIDEAIFFAVSERVDESGHDRLEAYSSAGHLISNHSHTHRDLHKIGAEDFSRDVENADSILREFESFTPLFRFPLLHHGQTIEERDFVRQELETLGYREGYVTIDNYDFYIDRLYQEALKADPDIELSSIGKFYAAIMLGAAEHYDNLACNWLGRSPSHVLLLHENDVAAYFIGDLAQAFRAAGWEIIRASVAYQDPIAEILPDTLFLGQGRVAALAQLAGAPEESLRHEGESIEFLDSAFRKAIATGN